jgi:hypothetical protein
MAGGMTTHDADSLGPEDSLAELAQAAGPELDGFGVPVRDQLHSTWDYRLALASLICAIVPLGLGVPFLIGRHKPHELLLLGMIPAIAAVFIGRFASNHPDRRIRRIAKAGRTLGILGFFAVVLASGNGAALNNAP